MEHRRASRLPTPGPPKTGHRRKKSRNTYQRSGSRRSIRASKPVLSFPRHFDFNAKSEVMRIKNGPAFRPAQIPISMETRRKARTEDRMPRRSGQGKRLIQNACGSQCGRYGLHPFPPQAAIANRRTRPKNCPRSGRTKHSLTVRNGPRLGSHLSAPRTLARLSMRTKHSGW